MSLICLDSIITDNLVVFIDISDIRSWNLNDELNLISLTQDKKAITQSINLPDFGLTAYDNARTNSLDSTLALSATDKRFKLYRVGENNLSGETLYNNYNITSVTTGDTTIGNYFKLAGGYHQGFFKLDGYPYQLMPSRYLNGITIETWLNLTPETYLNLENDKSGFFYLMGTRSENKYSVAYSGSTAPFSTEPSSSLVTEVINISEGQSIFYLQALPVGDVILVVNGVTLAEDQDYVIAGNQITLISSLYVSLENILVATYIKANQQDLKLVTESILVDQITSSSKVSFNNNQYALNLDFILTNERLVSLSLDGEDLTKILDFSISQFNPTKVIINSVINVGDIITISYIVNSNPQISYTQHLTSTGDTLGSDHAQDLELGVYNNVIGFRFNEAHSIGYRYIDYTGNTVEAYSPKRINLTGWTMVSIVFRPYEKIKDPDLIDCYPRRTGDLIFYINGREFWKTTDFDEFFFYGLDTQREKELGVPFNIAWGGGSFGLKNSWNYDQQANVVNINNALYDDQDIVYIQTNFTSPDDTLLDPDTSLFYNGSSSMHVVDDIGYTANSATTLDILSYDNSISITSGRTYTFSANIYVNHIFNIFSTGSTIGFSISGLGINYNLIQNQIYNLQTNGLADWVPITFTIITYNNFTPTTINFSIKAISDMGLLDTIDIAIDNLKYVESYINKTHYYAKDFTKNNLLIQQNFDGSFIGGIQKLRVYTNANNPQEIQHNFNSEKNKYGLKNNNGGRIIYI